MPKLLTFDGMEAGSVTWYEDLDTGAVVQVVPDSVIPLRKVNNPQGYVDQGVASISGEDDDNASGEMDLIADGLRAILVDVSPLDGDSSFWTVDDMTARIQSLEGSDETIKDLWLPPFVAEVSPSDEETDVAVDADGVVTFDKAMLLEDLVASNFGFRGQGGASDVVTSSVTINEDHSIITMLHSTPFVGGATYKVRVAAIRNAAGNYTAGAYVQTNGFTVVA